MNELKKGQLDARLKAKELRVLMDESSQNVTHENNHNVLTKLASPVLVMQEVVVKNNLKPVVKERPTLTLGFVLYILYLFVCFLFPIFWRLF